MEKSNSKIVIEDYKDSFVYKKNETNLNIQFNRVAFIFFVFFIIYLIYTIHLIHLGSRKSKIDIVDNISAVGDKLYRADIIDVNGNYCTSSPCTGENAMPLTATQLTEKVSAYRQAYKDQNFYNDIVEVEVGIDTVPTALAVSVPE